MKLKFTWVTGPAGPQATCTVQDASLNGVYPLACLLMDDGGVDTSTSLAWIREGLASVDAVLSRDNKSRTDWDRESWGAAVTEVETKVYSLHDDQCAEMIPTLMFRRALNEWMKFVEVESTLNSVVVDLSVASESSVSRYRQGS
jgi:hypothetical protein